MDLSVVANVWSSVLDLLDWWTTGRVGTLAACVAAAGALWAARVATRNWKQQQADSKARSRPMVVADLQTIPFVDGNASLVIRNYGPSLARNVRVAFDPPLPGDATTRSGKSSIIPFLVARYQNPIRVLPPGAALSNVYYVGTPDKDGDWSNDERVPDQITVKISYESDEGDAYEDVFPLDMQVLRKETTANSSTAPEAQLRVAVKHLGAIKNSLVTLAQAQKTKDRSDGPAAPKTRPGAD